MLAALWLLGVLTVEPIPASQTFEFDQLVSQNAIQFLTYDFQIRSLAANRLRIQTRAELAVTSARRFNCYFMLADVYRTRIHRMTLNGISVSYRHWNDIYQFRIPPQLRNLSRIRLDLDYEITSKHTSQLVRAELSGAWYPKNLFTERIAAAFRLIVPAGMIGIANGELEAVSNSGDSVIYHWQTDRFQTNLAVAIGRYHSFVRLIHSRTYRIYAPERLETDSRQLSLWASLIGEQYQAYFGGADYRGLTMVINDTSLEDTSFGALIFLHPGKNQPSKQKFFRLAHEIAHFWWGNLVIPRAPQDWWLAEGFANYFAFYLCEQLHHINHTFFDTTPNRALPGETAFNAFIKTIPADQPQDILADWQKQYHDFLINLKGYHIPEMSLAEIGPFDFQRDLLYNKGAFVLHMTRLLLGDNNFLRYIRRFVTERQMKQAGIRDFTRLGDLMYGPELADFFRQWVYSAGIYDLALERVKITRRAGKYHLYFKLRNKGQLYLPDMVDLEISTGVQLYHEVLFFQGVNVTIQKTLDEPPRQIVINGRHRILETDTADNVWRTNAVPRD